MTTPHPRRIRTQSVTVGEVERALNRIVDPCSIATGVPITLPDMGLVKSIRVEGDAVTVTLQLTSPLCFQVGNIVDAVRARVGELDGVGEVHCRIDPASEWMPDMIAPSARAALRRVRPRELPPAQPLERVKG